MDLLKDLKQLRPLMMKQDMWKFAILLGLMFFASFLDAAGVGAIPFFVTVLMKPSALAENRWFGSWFANLPSEPSMQIVLWASLIMILFMVSKTIFTLVVIYFQAKIGNGQRVSLCNRLFVAYQYAPYEWHLQHSSSELLRNIQNDTNQIIAGFIGPFLDLILCLTTSIFIIAVMVAIAPGSTIVGIILLGIGLFFVNRIFRKQLHHVGTVMRYEVKEMIQAIQQGFGALIDARILGCETYLNKTFRASMDRQAQVLCRRSVIDNGTPLIMENVLVIGLILILLVLITSVSSLDAALPVLSLLGVAAMRLKQLMTRITKNVNDMQSSRAYIPGVAEDMQILDDLKCKRCARLSSTHQIRAFETLKLDKVTYAYPNTADTAVKEISLEIWRGESIAFVGATGCGKSTLVNLILGLLEPQSGTVSVNGTDIFTDMKGWRAHLGYIPQSIFLIDDTIRANIAFGVPLKEVDEVRVERALRSARLDDFVQTLPLGIDTIVGERGVRLSGGQRQRLGIARALYFDPEVLVMDEATSALDNKTEAEVMEAIENLKKGRTLIMIAHRLSTVEDCARLYYLDDGHLVAFGSYDELKQSVPAFSQMAVGYH